MCMMMDRGEGGEEGDNKSLGTGFLSLSECCCCCPRSLTKVFWSWPTYFVFLHWKRPAVHEKSEFNRSISSQIFSPDPSSEREPFWIYEYIFFTPPGPCCLAGIVPLWGIGCVLPSFQCLSCSTYTPSNMILSPPSVSRFQLILVGSHSRPEADTNNQGKSGCW